ncbi:MAG: ribonuclease HII [Bacteroidales bacterium]
MAGLIQYQGVGPVAGCDEAGRGCLAGPVYAAAVILPEGYSHPEIRDSKLLSALRRERLAGEIIRDALAFAVASVEPEEIDRINILNASIRAMHLALDNLEIVPGLIIVDGNRFNPYRNIPHRCIIRGDNHYLEIAAASILAKTARDAYMKGLHSNHPEYGWISNKGYPSAKHIEALRAFGITVHHRKSFRVNGQLSLTFESST